LEKAACDAIVKEYASNVVIGGANFEESKIQRLMKKYEENKKKAQELIDRYDSFHYLYISILKELEIFTFNFFSLSSNYSHKLWKIGVNSNTSCKANNFLSEI